MSESVLIYNALCLPVPDVEALIQGRMIAATPRKFINPGQKFALYPANPSVNTLPPKRHYRSSFLSIAQQVIDNLDSKTVVIKGWARCEGCKMHIPESFEALSQLTIWTKEGLQQVLGQRTHIFLAYLRVYRLPEPLEVPVYTQERHFVPLPQQLTVSQANPVLSDRIFTIRKHQLETRQPPLHPELEDLQSALAYLAITNPAAKQLDQDIKAFLGWTTKQLIQQSDPDLAWINNIAALGDRSIEQDKGKSNYQAGTDFEDIARRSLEFLGFKVESDYKGGAGGLDLFCSKPYSLVCECKAGKSIPDRTVEELDRIGKRHLKENYINAVRLIIGPGKPTKQLQESAAISKISIINAMTLQKLVELQAKYPGSVDLIELKKYLEPGEINYKIDEYIQTVKRQIQLRFQIVQAVKQLFEQDNESLEASNQNFTVTEIRAHYNATQNPKLTDTAVNDFLIELSSPLTGYVGRIKGEDWRRDRFYFLRDLPTPQI
ncbi:DUF1802 domain-containing protein [Brasilonema octagenarum UFV-E1]|uniref:DUF1802 domain-containing protein n=2 Tax=Brasilonema TaxID=383614 RepID=A0A856MEW3_9CYAN|nr:MULTISPECIES: DUF1802 family protein [Brasilonema]NMF67259.1 DUF1802 domain-containing protein [Brasilonema octagenarum UFV-OR1]QDL07607.1 DUF1802 domain-containing protein [Brasilonema sennae CENA114]QDL13969.1 DUF1802 domain-containing protein [Brasilonema octagenarum UFV-E1]